MIADELKPEPTQDCGRPQTPSEPIPLCEYEELARQENRLRAATLSPETGRRVRQVRTD